MDASDVCDAISILGPPAAGEAAVPEIRALLDRWREAFRTSDVETLSTLIAEDGEFWTNGAAPVVGREAVLEALPPLFAAYRVEQRFACRELLVSTDLAVLRGTETNVLFPRGGGEAVERTQRAVSILRRDVDGQWRFARGMTNQPPES